MPDRRPFERALDPRKSARAPLYGPTGNPEPRVDVPALLRWMEAAHQDLTVYHNVRSVVNPLPYPSNRVEPEYNKYNRAPPALTVSEWIEKGISSGKPKHCGMVAAIIWWADPTTALRVYLHLCWDLLPSALQAKSRKQILGEPTPGDTQILGYLQKQRPDPLVRYRLKVSNLVVEALKLIEHGASSPEERAHAYRVRREILRLAMCRRTSDIADDLLDILLPVFDYRTATVGCDARRHRPEHSQPCPAYGPWACGKTPDTHASGAPWSACPISGAAGCSGTVAEASDASQGAAEATYLLMQRYGYSMLGFEDIYRYYVLHHWYRTFTRNPHSDIFEGTPSSVVSSPRPCGI